ncbi:unnamed protein product [Lampetra fluviatilis]
MATSGESRGTAQRRQQSARTTRTTFPGDGAVRIPAAVWRGRARESSDPRLDSGSSPHVAGVGGAGSRLAPHPPPRPPVIPVPPNDLHAARRRSWLETVLPALVVSALLLVGGVVAAAAQHHRCRRCCCPRWRRRSRRTDRVRPAAPRRAVLWDLAINRRVLAPRKAALLPREPRSPALLLAAANPGFLPAPSPPPPPPRYRLPPAYGRSRATSIFAVLDGACS